MKLLLFAMALIISASSFAGDYQFEKGKYEGRKMSPLPIPSNRDKCTINILEVFEGKGILVKFEKNVEYLKLISLENGNDSYKYVSLNNERTFGSGFTTAPKFQIFTYTDGPAFRSTNKIWDCTMLTLKD